MNCTYKKGGKKYEKYKKTKGITKKARGKSKRDITQAELIAFEKSKEEFEMTQLHSKKPKTVGDIRGFLQKHNVYIPSSLNKSALLDIYSKPTHMVLTTEKKSQVMARLSTLQYEAVKDYVNSRYEITQPEFTVQHRNKKKQIWGIKTLDNGKTSSAFSKYEVDIKKGDHIFGMREGLKTHNVLGSNSEWNLVPCTQKENVSWKKIKLIPRNEYSEEKYKKLTLRQVVNLLSKNLVYDEFSQEEIELFNPETYSKYTKLQTWIAYCDSVGAKLRWINGVQINNLVTQEILKKLLELDTSLKSLPYIDQSREINVTEKELSSLSHDDMSEAEEKDKSADLMDE